jgi:hypothetical protein
MASSGEEGRANPRSIAPKVSWNCGKCVRPPKKQGATTPEPVQQADVSGDPIHTCFLRENIELQMSYRFRRSADSGSLLSPAIPLGEA